MGAGVYMLHAWDNYIILGHSGSTCGVMFFGVSETTNWSDERVTVLLARVEDLVPGWRRRTDTRTCLCNMKRMTTKTWRPRTTQLEIRSGHLLPNCGGLAADLLKVSKSTACVLLPSGACQPKRPGIPWHFCQPLNLSGLVWLINRWKYCWLI